MFLQIVVSGAIHLALILASQLAKITFDTTKNVIDMCFGLKWVINAISGQILFKKHLISF
jgi:hypothetical protein